MTPHRILFIGCGNMGGAMLRRWVDSGTIDPASVAVVTRTERDLPPGVVQFRDLPTGLKSDIVVLAVKPQQVDLVAESYAKPLGRVPMLVSILAGTAEASLAARLDVDAVIRAMPNLPVAIGRGVVALHSTSAGPAARETVVGLMQPLGVVEWVEEHLFDAVTALAGSGPAFVYRMIDALAAGGTKLGIAPEQAVRLALATAEGATLLAAAANVSPGILADRVASPGGSTRKGLDVLDDDDALDRLIAETLAAAARRNAELAAGL